MKQECLQIQDMLEAYSVEALNPDEMAAVEAHLTGCEDCRALATEFQETAALLPLGLRAAAGDELPTSLKERVLASISTDASETVRLDRPRPVRRFSLAGRPRVPTIAAAAALILLAISVGWGLRQTAALAKERSMRTELAELVGQQQIIFDVVDSNRTSKAFLRAITPGATAYGKVYTRADLSTVVVFVAQMPKLEEGLVDHLWLTEKGETRLAGTLTLDDHGFGALVFEAGEAGPLYDSVQVVMEPEGTSRPTGTPIVRWDAPR